MANHNAPELWVDKRNRRQFERIFRHWRRVSKAEAPQASDNFERPGRLATADEDLIANLFVQTAPQPNTQRAYRKEAERPPTWKMVDLAPLIVEPDETHTVHHVRRPVLEVVHARRNGRWRAPHHQLDHAANGL